MQCCERAFALPTPLMQVFHAVVSAKFAFANLFPPSAAINGMVRHVACQLAAPDAWQAWALPVVAFCLAGPGVAALLARRACRLQGECCL